MPKKKTAKKKVAKKRQANKKGLTPKQRRFCEEYLVDCNATQAAIRAGYSKKTANEQGARLLANVRVAKHLKGRQEKLSERTQINQEYVLKAIVDTVERCQQGRPVLDKKGKQVFVETPEGEMAAAYVFDANSVLRGADLLGKHIGFFAKDNAQKGLADASPEEVAKILAQRLKAQGIKLADLE